MWFSIPRRTSNAPPTLGGLAARGLTSVAADDAVRGSSNVGCAHCHRRPTVDGDVRPRRLVLGLATS
jgi:hypothetical protein